MVLPWYTRRQIKYLLHSSLFPKQISNSRSTKDLMCVRNVNNAFKRPFALLNKLPCRDIPEGNITGQVQGQRIYSWEPHHLVYHGDIPQYITGLCSCVMLTTHPPTNPISTGKPHKVATVSLEDRNIKPARWALTGAGETARGHEEWHRLVLTALNTHPLPYISNFPSHPVNTLWDFCFHSWAPNWICSLFAIYDVATAAYNPLFYSFLSDFTAASKQREELSMFAHTNVCLAAAAAAGTDWYWPQSQQTISAVRAKYCLPGTNMATDTGQMRL